MLVSPGERDGQLRKDLERVGHVDPDVLLPGLDVDVGHEVAGADRADAVAAAHEIRGGFALGETRGVSVIRHTNGEPVISLEDLGTVLELQRHAPVLSERLGDTVLTLCCEREVAGERVALRIEESDRRALTQSEMERPPAGEHLGPGGIVDAIDFRVAVQCLALVIAIEHVAGHQQ